MLFYLSASVIKLMYGIAVCFNLTMLRLVPNDSCIVNVHFKRSAVVVWKPCCLLQVVFVRSASVVGADTLHRSDRQRYFDVNINVRMRPVRYFDLFC